MEIVLDKRTTIITENIQPGDYYRLNPFNPDGSIGIDVMSIIIDIPKWNSDSNTLFFYLPEISQLPTLNFQVNFTSYSYWNEYPSQYVMYAGNDVDSWDNGFIVEGGVMSWIPQSYEPTPNGNYGWWLVEQPNIGIPERPFTPVEPGVAARTASENTSTTIGGPEAFKALTAKFKK